MKLKYVLVAALLFSSVVQSAPSQQSQQQTSAIQSGQTQILQQQAGQWGLSSDEYQRYQQLMHGPRGIQSPGLDPLTTLGIEAKSESERRRFAELWVKEEFARTEKELKFQREVNAAWQRLYPDMLPVSLGNSQKPQVPAGRLALFVKAQDCTACDTQLLAILASGRPVDIYLTDSQGKDDRLRQWAKDRNIPVARVRARQITLNHDGGRWLKFGQGQMPVVLQLGDDGWHIAAF